MLRDLRADDLRDGVRAAADRPHRDARRRRRVGPRRARAKGVEFLGETFDTGVCHMAFFEDPDGNALMLHHRYSPRERGGA